MKSLLSGVWGRIIGCFFAGVFTILPVVITVAVVIWIAGFIQSIIGPETFLGKRMASIGDTVGVSNQGLAYLAGWTLVLAAIFLLGVFVKAGAKRLTHQLFDAIAHRIPIAGSVYKTATKVVGMLDKGDDDNMSGMKVVYCTFGKENPSGILALMPTSDVYKFSEREYYAVYIPTSPVPMTGGLMFVPIATVEIVDMSVDGLMSIYLSMGITGPQFLEVA